MGKKAVVALGGNAIIQSGQAGTITEQFANTRESLGAIAELVNQGYQLAIAHGNGPQVGNLLLQQMAGLDRKIAPLPLGVLNAATEGTMGYMIEQSLQNRLRQLGFNRNVVTLVTQVLIDPDDPSIKNPSKPVGPFYSAEQAELLQREYGWTMIEDAGRGYRQVVPSPLPVDILNYNIIRDLIEQDNLVIACGGGGVPVFFLPDGRLEGSDSVIDKDYAAALLANKIGADRLVILTGVEKVCLYYGKPEQRELDELSVADAKRYLEENHFPKGSMGPKIRASIRFLENGGDEVIITSLEKVVDAFSGKNGTRIHK
jgi:carbamate kinase